MVDSTPSLRRSRGCFNAGTLVHTREGLKPIEAVAIGDWVLSKPDTGGQQEYRQVLRTFCFDDKSVFVVEIIAAEIFAEANRTTRTLDQGEVVSFVATGNHQFWVNGEGWTRTDHLQYRSELQLQDGKNAVVAARSMYPLYRTDTQGIAWDRPGGDSDVGARIDLRGGAVRGGLHSEERVENDAVDWWEGDEKDEFRPPVFDLEVEGLHSYYVGDIGVWVRDGTVAPEGPLPLTREEFTRKVQREFYDLLGEERPTVGCRKSGCSRGAIAGSTMCRPHHYEMVRNESCPFDD